MNITKKDTVVIKEVQTTEPRYVLELTEDEATAVAIFLGVLSRYEKRAALGRTIRNHSFEPELFADMLTAIYVPLNKVLPSCVN